MHRKSRWKRKWPEWLVLVLSALASGCAILEGLIQLAGRVVHR
jgi:hypothetical protein